MIESITSENQFLYHYTKAETALNFILKDMTLRLGNYGATNDPKEAKSWQFNIGTNEDRDPAKYNSKDLSDWLSTELKGKTRLLCFSMDSTPLSGNHLVDIFNRGYSKPRMWAQYADNHAGMCLVFDKQKLIKLINDTFNAGVLYGPVIYRNRNVIPNFYSADDQQYTVNIDHLERVGREKYVQDHMLTHYQRLFFEKMTDWRDECEWRSVLFSKSDKDIFIDIRKCLSGVMFGEKTTTQNIDDAMQLTKKNKIKYMGLKWKNCSPWYDPQLKYIQPFKKSFWVKS